MRVRIRKVMDKFAQPKFRIGLATALLTIGFDLMWTAVGERFDDLESRGWQPVDDMATLRDLNALERRLAGEAIPPPPSSEGDAAPPPGP